MQIIINVPDTLPKVFVEQRVRELEESLVKEAQQAKQTVSKWQKMAQRIESNAFDLGDYTESFNNDRQEFRHIARAV